MAAYSHGAYGLGLGFASAQLTSVVLSEVPIMQSGEGSATQSTVRQLGTAVGSAISGASLAMAVNGTLPARLESLGLPAKVGDGLAQAVSGSAGGVIGVFRSGDGPAARFGDEAPKIADAMTSGSSKEVSGRFWSPASCCSSVYWPRWPCVVPRRRTTCVDA